jgi:hypothetical protein
VQANPRVIEAYLGQPDAPDEPDEPSQEPLAWRDASSEP